MTETVMTSQLVFARESVDRLRQDADFVNLIVAHWKEIGHYKDFVLLPDWVVYEKAEKRGAVRVYTARRKGELIGYCVFFTHNSLHYSKVFEAQQDILFIHKLHRGLGHKFIAWCDEQLRSDGFHVVFHHMKAAHDFSPMLKRLGYELVDHIYAKRLDR